MKKFKKFIPLLILIVAALSILVWGCLETEGTESYNYEGYIIDIQETKEGTVLTTQNGNIQSEFVVKRNTKEKYNGEVTQLRVGDCIKLNTTKRSDRDIAEFSVYSGFNMTGKIFYTEGSDAPYLITPQYSYYRIFALILAKDSISVPQAGTEVKVYFQYPMNAATVNLVVDIIAPTSENATSLSQEEIEYLTDKGYLLTGIN